MNEIIQGLSNGTVKDITKLETDYDDIVQYLIIYENGNQITACNLGDSWHIEHYENL